jgi:hypothetical protein
MGTCRNRLWGCFEMQNMTPEQRESFIQKRVRAILIAYEDNCKTIDAMTIQERDDYVHARVERDLSIAEAIDRKQGDYVAFSQTLWREMLMLDVIGLLILAWLAVRDVRDVIGFSAVAAVMVVSRVVNYNRNRMAAKILELDRARIAREVDTATLDFLIDAVRHEEEAGSGKWEVGSGKQEVGR